MQHLIADRESSKEFTVKIKWMTEGTVKVQANNIQQAIDFVSSKIKDAGFNPELTSSIQHVIPGTLTMGKTGMVTVSELDSVRYIRLLTGEEFKAYRDIIPMARSPHSGEPSKWWLDPCDTEMSSRYFALAVMDGFRICMAPPSSFYGVRPVIEFKGSGQEGSTVPYKDYTWTILHSDGRGNLTALCDSIIGFSNFSWNEPEYSNSVIQEYLNKWAMEVDLFNFGNIRPISSVGNTKPAKVSPVAMA